jgi:hypothetical protein
VLYWGDCQDGKTSHTTNGGYVIDVAKEEIGGTCAWYAPYFAKMVPKKEFSTGHKVPGIAAACKLMVECTVLSLQWQAERFFFVDRMLALKDAAPPPPHTHTATGACSQHPV